MELTINNNVNFGAKLVLPQKKYSPFSSKINIETVKDTFEKRTKHFSEDLKIINTGKNFRHTAFLGDEMGSSITNLSLKNIEDENKLTDKLVRAYKMLVTETALFKTYDAEEVEHYIARLEKLAGDDKDLNKFVCQLAKNKAIDVIKFIQI